jgi:hypothetical protein
LLQSPQAIEKEDKSNQHSKWILTWKIPPTMRQKNHKRHPTKLHYRGERVYTTPGDFTD